jgi:hypothetical protein
LDRFGDAGDIRTMSQSFSEATFFDSRLGMPPPGMGKSMMQMDPERYMREYEDGFDDEHVDSLVEATLSISFDEEKKPIHKRSISAFKNVRSVPSSPVKWH